MPLIGEVGLGKFYVFIGKYPSVLWEKLECVAKGEVSPIFTITVNN